MANYCIERLPGVLTAGVALKKGQILAIDGAAAADGRLILATSTDVAAHGVALSDMASGDRMDAAAIKPGCIIEMKLDGAVANGDQIGITSAGEATTTSAAFTGLLIGTAFSDGADGDLHEILVTAIHKSA